MEGMFVYSYRSTAERDIKDEVAQILKHKKELRVCSLSKTFDCHLLWAHYADGFRGLAVEVELQDDDPAIKGIRYGEVFAGVSLKNPVPPDSIAEQVLSSKYREWSYEKEVRILQREKYFNLRQPVRRIIAGHRMDPSLFQALRNICESKEIILHRTGIGDEGIDADYVPPLNEMTHV